ncbi:hypothetical protein T440DRAFT_198790 [Plenodomus tracheiphilus IPT5]|uniref:Uncharacterized protein n=1 Tax=Plenodomus tracheiphilus IPT5 TaxID=1408161 RepID=A0A6A7BLC0_9PLEO|nr:hypothetical protein T440DRAFT_198790 [Plenodomus tracheiphilus IPT5]
MPSTEFYSMHRRLIWWRAMTSASPSPSHGVASQVVPAAASTCGTSKASVIADRSTDGPRRRSGESARRKGSWKPNRDPAATGPDFLATRSSRLCGQPLRTAIAHPAHAQWPRADKQATVDGVAAASPAAGGARSLGGLSRPHRGSAASWCSRVPCPRRGHSPWAMAPGRGEANGAL